MRKTSLLLSGTFMYLSSFNLANGQTRFLPETYVVISKAGMNNSAKDYYISTSTDPSSETFSVGSVFTLPYNINGAGLNIKDSFLYCATYVGADNTVGNNLGVSLYRVGADGNYVDLGLLPTTGQTSVEFVNFSSGTMDDNGTYYYVTFGLKPSGITKILAAELAATPPTLDPSDIRGFLCWLSDVDTLTSNPGDNAAAAVTGYYELDFSNAYVTAALAGFLDNVNINYPDIYNADGGLQDFDIHPSNGLIYGYISYPESGITVGRPVVFNTPVAGISEVEPVGTIINSDPGQEIAGIMFAPDETLYGLFTTGDYAIINLSTGALEDMAMSNIPIASGNLRGDLAAAFFTDEPLPVSLRNFNAKFIDNIVQLKWQTLKEQNLAFFIIERSTDSKHWVSIQTINSKAPGGSTMPLEYAAMDEAPLPGNNYYRLRQVDIDGSSVYSTTRVVQATGTNNTTQIYPNPAKDQLHILSSEAIAQATIYNSEGKEMVNSKAASIAVDNLPQGVYVLLIKYKDGITDRFRFIKK